jgi:LuxR family quorum sensing-dependent transcriptional regulator
MHSDDVFAFVDRCQTYSTAKTILDDLLATSRGLGFEHLLFSGVPVGDQELAPMVELNGWPPQWFDRYNSEGHFRVDGVCLHAARTLRPFAWSEIPGELRETEGTRRVAGEAEAFGIRTGFVVPMLSLDHWQSAISFASSARAAEMSELERAQLITMATVTGVSVQAIALDQQQRANPVHLTDREREVLLWFQSGKSAWEIGEILGISERTANKHAASARQKFGVATTRQAAAEAARRRLLHF